MFPLLLMLGFGWHIETQYVSGHTYVQEVAHVDAKRVVTVEHVTWEGPEFWPYEVSFCGTIFAIGEERTRDDARAAALVAVTRHIARRGDAKCTW